MRTRIILGFLAITLALAGCGGDDDDAPAAAAGTGGSGGSGGSGGGNGIEIEGTWASDFGTEVIDDDSWSSDFGSSAITQYSNEENVAVTQNADDAAFDPSKFNRIVWTEIAADSFYYCTTDFGLDTEDEAAESDTAPDASDPENGGCSDFPWSKLTRD